MYTAYTAPKFGVLVNSDVLNNDQKAAIARDTLNGNYARTSIITQQWNGSSSRFEKYAAKNLLQAVNINYTANGSGEPFPTGTDLTNYIDTLTLILNKYPTINLVVIFNEEFNQSYHSGPITDYCKVLQAAYPICHARNIKMTNGGVAGFPVEVSTYRWVQGKYGQTAADNFGAACMTNSQVNAAKNPGSNPTIEAGVRQMDTILLYKAYYDFANIHIYQPVSETNTRPDTVTQVSPLVWRYESEWFTASSGKPTITNETGMRNDSLPALVTSMVNDYLRLGTQYVIFFDGFDGTSGTYGLTDDNTGAVLPTGISWRTIIAANQSNTQLPN